MTSEPSFSRLYNRAGIEAGTRQASVFGVGISFIVFISVVMGLRMYVRVKMIQAVGVDDSMYRLFQQVLFANRGGIEIRLTKASSLDVHWNRKLS